MLGEPFENSTGGAGHSAAAWAATDRAAELADLLDEGDLLLHPGYAASWCSAARVARDLGIATR